MLRRMRRPATPVMIRNSLGDVVCFAHVERTVGTAQYVDEPHPTTMASSAEEWKWMEEVDWPFDSLAARLRRAARSLRAFDQSNGSP